MSKFTKFLLVPVLILQVGIFMPVRAQASLISDIMKGIELAGYWPSELPAPDAFMELVDIAQKCPNSDIGDCVNMALANDQVSDALGEAGEKITFALDVYYKLRDGDYLGLIVALGKPAGCFAASMIVGVPVCSFAEALASIAGAVASVGEDIYAFLQEQGAHAVWESDDYWDIYYDPNIALGVKIHLNTPPDKLLETFGALSGPLYSGCVDLLERSHPLSDSKIACKNLENQFVAVIHTELGKFLLAGQEQTKLEFDKMSPAWLQVWQDQCNLSAGASSAVDDMIQSCRNKVAQEIANARALAVTFTESALIPNTTLYDGKAAAEGAYHYYKTQMALKEAVKQNQQLELDYKNNPNNPEKVLANIKNELENFNKDTGPWQEECKFGDYSNECKWQIKLAWYSCQKKLNAIPTISDLKLPDEKKINAMKSQCGESYSAIISSFAVFTGKRSLALSMMSLCPKEPEASGILFPAAFEKCKKDVNIAADKCAGGVPQFSETYFTTKKMSQSPEPIKNCDGEIKFVQDHWGQEGPLYDQIEAAYQSARAACVSAGLGEPCVNEVMFNVKECRASVGQQSNALGLIPTAPAYQSDFKEALKKMNSSTEKCIANILKTPESFAKLQAVTKKVMETYEKQCPSNQGPKMMFEEQCKAELMNTVEKCLNEPLNTFGKISKIGGTNPSAKPAEVSGKISGVAGAGLSSADAVPAKCKPQLDAVIESYKKKASEAMAKKEKPGKVPMTGAEAAAKSAVESETPKAVTRKNLMKAPPTLIQSGAVKASAETPLETTPPKMAPVLPGAKRLAPIGGVVKPPTVITVPQGTRAILPATPLKQLQDKGCVLANPSRVANTFNCKTDEAMNLCEQLKADKKVGGCVKVN